MTLSAVINELIRVPSTPAAAERRPTGDYHIRWTPDATAVHIYTGSSPATIERAQPYLTAPGSNHEALITGLDPASPVYFELLFAGGPVDGQALIVAERFLPLQGGVNIRDIGGYSTDEGRTVRWGQLYRSGTLTDLTDDDVTYLARCGIHTVCDLRTEEEVANFPDRLPPGATHRHMPVGGVVGRVRQTVTLFRKRNRLQEVLQEVYTRVMIAQNAPMIGDLFRLLADPGNLPLVIHCTAGKDRTGVAVGLLLSFLGVDDATIAADYSLSNYYYETFVGQMTDDLRRLVSLGFSDEQVRPFLLAEPVTILGMLAYVRDRYGSVAAYLQQQGGLTSEHFDRIRDNLLT